MNVTKLRTKKRKLEREIHKLKSKKHYRDNRDQIQGRRYFAYSVKIIDELINQKLVNITPKGLRLSYKGRNLYKNLGAIGGKNEI